MAAGCRLTNGDITKYFVDENELWATFNFVFSETCTKQSTYKYGLIKSILDNLLSAVKSDRGMELSYRAIFSKFAENYWNLITKYHLRQVRPNARYNASEIEKIFQAALQRSKAVGEIEFSNLADSDRDAIIAAVSRECNRCVIGALYSDFEGYLLGDEYHNTYNHYRRGYGDHRDRRW